MLRRHSALLLIIGFLIILNPASSSACQICGCSLSRPDQQTTDKSWFVEYVFEQQDWKRRDPQEAFELGQDGHDTHDKTTEDFHHYLVGARIGERILITGEIPYIVRRALNVEDPDHLGDHQRSQGWGDLQVTGQYDFLKDHDRSVGAVAGVKFPTGSTEELDSTGEKFEPEMQPGSGSYDYYWGAVYRQNWQRWMFAANAVYTLRTTGAADFRFGNGFATVMDVDYMLNPHNRTVRVRPGVQLNYHHEAQQIDEGVKVIDSGGETIFLGPILSLDLGRNSTLFSSFSAPVYEDPGGVHQKLDWLWTVGGKVSW